MPKDIREVRGIPLWLMREYIEEAGGKKIDDGLVEGAGWTVRLTQLEDFTIGSLSVGEIRIEMEGTEKGLAEIRTILEPKLLRAGG